ncbi:hypothetical protein NM688_g7704 [Phlebia brevispora]|uniref:Uncharacterized protein n=1 Tax=Phlebia brevispora TaxID=194682 RepID=A0ACC1S229_9APHY|nr:hypothetical protein NM688_g7704 [Phlebia brevispora]
MPDIVEVVGRRKTEAPLFPVLLLLQVFSAVQGLWLVITIAITTRRLFKTSSKTILTGPGDVRDGPSFMIDLLCNNYLNSCILDACSPATLIRLALSCRDAAEIVKAYIRLRFNVDRLLIPFFSDVAAFRVLQAETGMLISGSTALQFFLRTTYAYSDLDLYVHRDHRVVVGRYLLDSGYTFVPNNHQNPDFLEAVSQNSIDSVTGNYGRMYGVATVFTFQNAEFRTVQVILAVSSPLAVVLLYHSSAQTFAILLARTDFATPLACILNVISHDMAYCLYPRATLEDRCSLLLRPDEILDPIVMNKYVNRGFQFAICAREEDAAFLPGQLRWLGDKYCWRIPVNTSAIATVPEPDTLTNSSWRLVNTPRAKMEFDVLSSPGFQNVYIAGDSTVRAMFVAFSLFSKTLLENDIPYDFDVEFHRFCTFWLSKHSFADFSFEYPLNLPMLMTHLARIAL